MITSIAELQQRLAQVGYLTSRQLATSLFISLKLQKPILIEGPAGVGKTYLAKALARALGQPLFRLQCYEGLDESKALYEWDYQKQLMYIQTQKLETNWEQHKSKLFSMEFCLPRPILSALLCPQPNIVLIDELDKTDEQFESFLLEAMEEYQVTIPELGTVEAKTKPTFVLTSNDSRQFSDALKRRCIHTYIDFPELEQEYEIVMLHLPELAPKLAQQLLCLVHRIRRLELHKLPSVAETVEWARFFALMGVQELDSGSVEESLGVILKHKQDVATVKQKLAGLLAP